MNETTTNIIIGVISVLLVNAIIVIILSATSQDAENDVLELSNNATNWLFN